MTLVAYLSHPIGPQDRFTAMAERHDNLENAGAWLKFLVLKTRWAVMCPWLAYITAMGEGLHSPRALTDQIILLERCDLMVQVGGWLSPHMTIEQNHANRMGLPIVNLTDLGTRPRQEDFIEQQLKERTKALGTATKRRAWLPPLEDKDIDALRAAQLVLQQDPFSDDARALIARIVQAAMRR